MRYQGYATEIVTDLALEWLDQRDRERPFLLLCHHKAPHRLWEPAEKHADLYNDVEIPYQATFNDDYQNRSSAAVQAEMRIFGHMNYGDLKLEIPPGKTAMSFIEIPQDLAGFSLTPVETGIPQYCVP